MSRPLYARNGVIVTWYSFSAHGYRYDTAGLRNLVWTRGPVHTGTVVSLVIAAGNGVLAVPILATGADAAAWPVAALAILVPSAVAVVCAKRWPPRWELQATYRGRRVCLLRSREEHEFWQVARALQRAVEAIRDQTS